MSKKTQYFKDILKQDSDEGLEYLVGCYEQGIALMQTSLRDVRLEQRRRVDQLLLEQVQ
jgi:hypothetical protein